MVTDSIHILGLCFPYTKRACLTASTQLGLQIGDDVHEFIGDYSIKGCHSKDGTSFFGVGGSIVDHQKSLVAPNYRPNGYDCGNH